MFQKSDHSKFQFYSEVKLLMSQLTQREIANNLFSCFPTYIDIIDHPIFQLNYKTILRSLSSIHPLNLRRYTQ